MKRFNNKGNATVLAVSVCLAIIFVMCVIFGVYADADYNHRYKKCGRVGGSVNGGGKL